MLRIAATDSVPPYFTTDIASVFPFRLAAAAPADLETGFVDDTITFAVPAPRTAAVFSEFRTENDLLCNEQISEMDLNRPENTRGRRWFKISSEDFNREPLFVVGKLPAAVALE